MQKNSTSSLFFLFFVCIIPLSLESAYGPITRKRKEVCSEDPTTAGAVAREDFITDILSHAITKQGEKRTNKRNVSARIKFYDYPASSYADQKTRETVASLAQEAGLGHKKFYTCIGDETELHSFKPFSSQHFILQLESKEPTSEQPFSILHELGHASLSDKKALFPKTTAKAANHQEELFCDIYATTFLLKKKEFLPVASSILSFLTIDHKECFTHPASERRARLMLSALEKLKD
jgi:hypothetical protein